MVWDESMAILKPPPTDAESEEGGKVEELPHY
jgi:hypothetical protein